MDKLLEELLELIEPYATERTFAYFKDFKEIDLDKLYENIAIPMRSHKALIVPATMILGFGYIDSKISDYEETGLKDAINDEEKYNYVRRMLLIFRELSDLIKPYVNEHPLALQYLKLDAMAPLAAKQDLTLMKVINSMPKDYSEKEIAKELIKETLDNISAYLLYKKMNVYNEFFTYKASPKIQKTSNLCDIIAVLYSYIRSKQLIVNNAHVDILKRHAFAKELISCLDSKEGNEYIEVSDKMNIAHSEFVDSLERTLLYKM